MKRKKNFNLKKEKYSNLTKDSCVNNEITNKYIVTDEPNEGKRNNFEDIKKTIKTNNDKLFNEFSFEVDKKDKNSLKKLFKKAPNREKDERKQKKFKQKKLNKKRG